MSAKFNIIWRRPSAYFECRETREAVALAFPILLGGMALALFIPKLSLAFIQSFGGAVTMFQVIVASAFPPQFFMLVPPLLSLARARTRDSLWARCGLTNWKNGYWREVPVLYFALIFPVLIFSARISVLTLQALGMRIVSPIEALFEGADLNGVLVICAVGMILAPIAEELAFRRVAFTFFKEFMGTGPAIALTALGFASIHGALVQFLPLFILGVFLQLLYIRHNSIIPCVMAHFLNNAIPLVQLLLLKVMSDFGWTLFG